MLGITIERVPRKGYLLAYFRDALVFEPYSVEDGRLVFPGWEAPNEPRFPEGSLLHWKGKRR